MRGLEKIIGQTTIVSRLRALKDFFAEKQAPPGHILLIGPDGMGKRTIALSFAEEFGSTAKVAFGRSIERKGDLSAILTDLEAREFLLIEEICRMRQAPKEILGLALEDFRIDLVAGQGAGARIFPFRLNPFTCIGTSLRETDCPMSLRNLFSLKLSIENYSIQELGQIAERIAASNYLTLTPNTISLIARASDGTPRHLEVLVRQLARAGTGVLSDRDAEDALSALGLMNSRAATNTQSKSLDSLSGIEFEEFVTKLLRVMGFRTQITKASGDGGVDIVAVLDKPIIGGRYLLQCKRLASDSLVGAPTIREFYGAVKADRKASKGILVTTSGFTIQAKEFAGEVGIELIDGQQLGILVAEYGNLEEEQDGPATNTQG
jgi:Holliday junction resolvasome RuvABC ATP-dependent DNA helicase subunit